MDREHDSDLVFLPIELLECVPEIAPLYMYIYMLYNSEVFNYT